MTAIKPRKHDSVGKPQKIEASDFVAVIADHLISRRFSRAQVEAAVRKEITDLASLFVDKEPFLGWRAENQEHAKEIAKILRKLQQKLNGAPKGTQMALFAFGRYGNEIARPQDMDWEEVARYKIRFFFYLESMGRSCSIIGKNPIGTYHTADQEKQRCATSALLLMMGLNAGEPASSSENSPLRLIANALFETACHERAAEWRGAHKGESADLRRQCGEALADWRKRPEAERELLCREARAAWGLHE